MEQQKKNNYIYIYIYIYIFTNLLSTSIHSYQKKLKKNPARRGANDKFPYIFRMGTFIDSTHMKL